MGSRALSLIIWANKKAKRVAIRLRGGIHPKHLMPDADYWYLPHIPKHAAVLDVGCGTGAHARRIASAHRFVYAIDATVPPQSEYVSFAEVSLERGLPAFGIAFDVVLCLDVLEHVHNRAELLRGIRESMTPGGTLLLAVPNIETSWKRRLIRAGIFPYADPDHKTEYTWIQLIVDLTEAGFVIAERHPGVYDSPVLVGILDVLGGLSLTLYRWGTNFRRRLAMRYPQEDCGFYVVCLKA